MNIIIYNKKKCLYHQAAFLLTIFTLAAHVGGAPGCPKNVNLNHALHLNVNHTNAEVLVSLAAEDALDVYQDVDLDKH